MVEGRIKKYYQEICLLEQVFVKDPSKSVSQMINEAISEIGENIQVRRFTRYQMGEGLEKRQDDFVNEVMAEINK
jgi:elongation factor Ts